ncbi:dual specificity protein phosphatase [Phycisphaeraceae bacterium D3-23]
MDCITECIYIGNHVEAHDDAVLKENGICSVLSLYGSYVGKESSSQQAKQIYAVELIDGAGNSIQSLRNLTAELIRMSEEHPPVLIHCHAGRSRSVAAAAAFLVIKHKLLPAEAIALVRKKRDSYLAPELERLVYQIR